MIRRLILIFSCLAAVWPFAASTADAKPAARPNIIFILMDDLRWDEMDYPFVRVPNIDRIAREGIRFSNAFVTTPLCSPSRASFLTGQYAHKHGITDNTARDAQSHRLITFPRLLHDAGYETAFVGKWHMGLDDNPRPGIDYWVSIKGQGVYLDPEINDNGNRKKIPGYVTDIFSDFSAQFLERKHEKPFLLYVAHKAVHPDLTQNADGTLSDPSAGRFIPAERHKKLYAGATIPHLPNYGVPPADKPALSRKLGDLPPLSEKTGTDDETIRNRLRMLAAVDESIGRIFKILEETHQLDNTMIIFTSDEGYFYGEHGLSVERRLSYEESARIPLYVRFPRMIKPGRTANQMVLNIDLAPTLLDLAGAPGHPQFQGRSLVPLFEGKSPKWRDAFLVEYWSDTVFPRMNRMGYQCVRTDRYKYIHYVDLHGMDELYDLKTDPYELHNIIADKTSSELARNLEKRRLQLLK